MVGATELKREDGVTQEERDELGRRVDAVYEQKLKAVLERDHMDEFVGIEPESGDYFLGKTLGGVPLVLHNRTA
jgi:hypothetical protein